MTTFSGVMTPFCQNGDEWRSVRLHTLRRDIGTAFYTFLLYSSAQHDSVFISVTADRQWVRHVSYAYHDRLSGSTSHLHFDNEGNGEYRNENFVFQSIHDLLIQTNRINPSPEDQDQYYLVLKDFIVFRILQLIRIQGKQITKFPAVYHLTLELDSLTIKLVEFLRSPLPDDFRAGSLELTWR